MVAIPQALLARPRPSAGPAAVRRVDVVASSFLVAAFVAPLDLRIVNAFTLHDLLIAAIAFMLVANARPLLIAPRAIAAGGIVFLLFALLSTFRATEPVQALMQNAQFAFVFFLEIPVALTVVRTRRMLHATLAMLVAGSLFAIVVAMVFSRQAGAHRLATFYSDNPNRLGYPTAYLSPFVLLFVFALWRSRHRVAAVVTAGVIGWLMLWAVAASGSRGGALGTVVALPLFIVLLGRPTPRVVVRRVVVVAGLVTAVGLLLFNSSFLPTTLEKRVNRTAAGQETLIEDRARLTRAGFREFEESPLLGTGLDNFRHVATRYDDFVTSQAPHNMWLQFLVQVGLIGTVGFVVVIIAWAGRLNHLWRHARLPADRDLAWAFLVSLIAIMTIFMTTPLMIHRHYWLLFALGLALVTMSHEAAAAGHRPFDPTRRP